MTRAASNRSISLKPTLLEGPGSRCRETLAQAKSNRKNRIRDCWTKLRRNRLKDKTGELVDKEGRHASVPTLFAFECRLYSPGNLLY